MYIYVCPKSCIHCILAQVKHTRKIPFACRVPPTPFADRMAKASSAYALVSVFVCICIHACTNVRKTTPACSIVLQCNLFGMYIYIYTHTHTYRQVYVLYNYLMNCGCSVTMYVCIYVYVYICTYMYTQIYVLYNHRVHSHYVCVYICVYTYMYTEIYVLYDYLMNGWCRVSIYVYVYVCMYVCIYIYI